MTTKEWELKWAHDRQAEAWGNGLTLVVMIVVLVLLASVIGRGFIDAMEHLTAQLPH